jgi:uncharacterized membrane protein HdeD (DUF308 family)
MQPATTLVIGFVALVGAYSARVMRGGATRSFDRWGQVLAGLIVGVGAALAILIPRIDVVQDGAEWLAAMIGILAGLLAFAGSWVWLARE